MQACRQAGWQAWYGMAFRQRQPSQAMAVNSVVQPSSCKQLASCQLSRLGSGTHTHTHVYVYINIYAHTYTRVMLVYIYTQLFILSHMYILYVFMYIKYILLLYFSEVKIGRDIYYTHTRIISCVSDSSGRGFVSHLLT